MTIEQRAAKLAEQAKQLSAEQSGAVAWGFPPVEVSPDPIMLIVTQLAELVHELAQQSPGAQ